MLMIIELIKNFENSCKEIYLKVVIITYNCLNFLVPKTGNNNYSTMEYIKIKRKRKKYDVRYKANMVMSHSRRSFGSIYY